MLEIDQHIFFLCSLLYTIEAILKLAGDVNSILHSKVLNLWNKFKSTEFVEQISDLVS